MFQFVFSQPRNTFTFSLYVILFLPLTFFFYSIFISITFSFLSICLLAFIIFHDSRFGQSVIQSITYSIIPSVHICFNWWVIWSPPFSFNSPPLSPSAYGDIHMDHWSQRLKAPLHSPKWTAPRGKMPRKIAATWSCRLWLHISQSQFDDGNVKRV